MTLNSLVLEEASSWFVNFRVGDVDEQAQEEFNQWLRRSPEHIQAYLEIAGTWADLPAARPDEIDAAALIAQAGGRRNVVDLNRPAAQPTPPARRTKLLWAACIALCVAGAAGFWIARTPAYSTGIGEQRFLTLVDGSSVVINAQSRLRVHFNEQERGVQLEAGQAMFHVASDTVRPFVVTSGTARVQALGTQFDVYRKTFGTTVTVIEGRVAVSALDGARASLLAAGEQVTVNASMAPLPKRANLAAATAWTQRRMMFDATRLSDVAREFNRYNRRPLVVEGATLADMHISGVYSSTDPASLLHFLRDQPGVGVQETPDEIRVFEN